MSDWDASSSDEETKKTQQPVLSSNRFGDEDLDEPEQAGKSISQTITPAPPKNSSGKTLKQKIAEKEAEHARRMTGRPAEADDLIDMAHRKRFERQAQLEQDLKLAEELTAGVSTLSMDDLTNVDPKTLADFQAFAEKLQVLIQTHASKPLYPRFLMDFIDSLTSTLNADDAKTLATRVSVTANERMRAAKDPKKKKQTVKPQLGGTAKTGKAADIDDYDGDDFGF